MIIQRFEQQVSKCRDKIALRMGDEALTYGELNGRANETCVEIKAALRTGNGEKQVSLMIKSLR